MSTNYTFADDESMPHVVYESNWRKAIPKADAVTETAPLTFAESTTQTAVKVSVEAQTDAEEGEHLSEEALRFEGWNAPSDVVDFLRRVSPMMTAQLAANASSHAFDDFDAFAGQDEEQVACLHTMNVTWEQPTDELDEPSAGAGVGARGRGRGAPTPPSFPCTGTSWSSTGSVLCASFGRLDHEGWCTHRAGLATWNLFKRDFSGDKPEHVLETSSCLMCVACHPLKPSVVVGGTYNGEIIVWDTNRDEPVVASSRIDDYLHREAVSEVGWFFDMIERDYFIASVSGDGKVLFWTLRNNLAYPVQGFRLTPATKRKGQSRATRALAGCTAIGFTHEGKLSSSFVLGSEGGGVYRCLLRRRGAKAGAGSGAGAGAAASAAASVKTDMKWDEPSLLTVARVPDRHKVVRHVERFAREKGVREVTTATIYDAKPESSHIFPNPVDFKYQPHVGPVHALDCSTFHRNLFVSCGSDGRVNVFSVLQAPPLLTLEPSTGSGSLFAAAFSRSRPLVFAVGGADGTVYLYDLQRNTSAPVEELCEVAEGHVAGFHKSPAVLSLAFNPKQRKLLAAGDGAGNIRVWRLGWRMANEQPGEGATLNNFMGVSEAVL